MGMAHCSRFVSPARALFSVTAAVRVSETHWMLWPNSSETYRAGIMVRPFTTLARFSVSIRLPSSVTLARLAARAASAFSASIPAVISAHSASVTALSAEQSRN